MSNLRDFTGKNRAFTGTDAETISKGTTAERVDGQAKLRFNTTTNLMEYYTGTDWKAIDAPPILTAITIDGGADVTSGTVDNEASGTVTIEVKGSLFDTTGGTVTFEGTAETLSTATITRNSANLLTTTVTAANFDLANSPYSVKVTNGSGLSATLADAISVDTAAPTFTNAADTNYDIFDSLRSSGTITANELVGASGATAYAVQSGSLPTGCTLNTSTGVITWSSVSAVGSDTVSTFTIRATGDDATADRQFTITVKIPVAQTYTSGSGTFSVPSGVSSLNVLVVGSGGAGGSRTGGGAGAGGMVDMPGYPVTPGGSVPYSVAGAPSPGTNPISPGSHQGNSSTFGNLTAIGGGHGGTDTTPRGNEAGGDGGSGGGVQYGGGNPAGTGNQPNQSGDSGTYGYGNPGGGGRTGPHHCSGGGGGAGGAGQAGGGGPSETEGDGGAGRVSNVSGSPVTYAGGGGGGGHPNCNTRSNTTGGGGIGGTPQQSQAGQAGTSNRGGGGGGAFQHPPQSGDQTGGAGGSGIVIVSY